jgi:hypothetical protein
MLLPSMYVTNVVNKELFREQSSDTLLIDKISDLSIENHFLIYSSLKNIFSSKIYIVTIFSAEAEDIGILIN